MRAASTAVDGDGTIVSAAISAACGETIVGAAVAVAISAAREGTIASAATSSPRGVTIATATCASADPVATSSRTPAISERCARLHAGSGRDIELAVRRTLLDDHDSFERGEL